MVVVRRRAAVKRSTRSPVFRRGEGSAGPRAGASAVGRAFALRRRRRLRHASRFFRRHGVQQATMAGKFHKVILFQKCTSLKHLPDLRGLRT